MATLPLPPCPFSCTSLSRKAVSSGVTCVCSQHLGLVLTGVPLSCGGRQYWLAVPKPLTLSQRERGFRYALKTTHTPSPQRETPPKHAQLSDPRRNRQCG